MRDVMTLDGLLERFPAPAVLKMEEEGGEASALRGAAKLVEEVRPVWLLEVPGAEGLPAVTRLQQAGYKVQRIDGQTDDKAALRVDSSSQVVALP
jgi:hypothetical protein